VCRRQQVITSTLMTRGLETRNIDLGCLLVFRNDFAQPVPMEMVVFAIHMAKANKQMQQDDYRAIIHHVNALRDPDFCWQCTCAAAFSFSREDRFQSLGCIPLHGAL
jgi:hypothetical protein